MIKSLSTIIAGFACALCLQTTLHAESTAQAGSHALNVLVTSTSKGQPRLGKEVLLRTATRKTSEGAEDGYDVAAFYWPSLHYDARWAEFFPGGGKDGEWESIRNCKPKWEGHWQPRVPAWGYLEPDERFGMGYLEAVKDVFVTQQSGTDVDPVAVKAYRDGRPAATLRMDAQDHGIVLRYGDGPDRCDTLGARDVWVYWSKDLNRWDAKNKAVVLDGQNCNWSKKCIGLPSVIRVGDRLAIFYDAPGGSSISHMKRHVGLAWLELPLREPSQ